MTEEETKNNSKGGPKTPEGKSVSKFNALKHGLLTREVLVCGEDDQILIDFGTAIKNQLEPEGPMEEILVDRIISGFWRLRRAIYVERETMEWHQNDYEMFNMMPESEEQAERKGIRDMLNNKSVENILRYETTIERSVFRALHELERLQAKRNGEKPSLPGVLDIDIQGMGSFGKNASE
ncbi:MAG: hypothetical protein V4469_05130 [Patescibacteria group bacterium]